MKRTIIIALSVVALVFGVISYATAADFDTTAVTANVGTLLEVTAPDPVNFGSITPVAPGVATVTVSGKSNKEATMSAEVTNDNFTTLTSTALEATTGLRGGNIGVDYKIVGTVDYDLDPTTALTGSVKFSMVQE